MIIFLDFIHDNIIKHVDVFSILNLRMTAKNFKNYKILKQHNYIRKLNSVTDIIDFKNIGDFYYLSITFEDNYISDTVFKKINKIIVNNPIYSINITNNPNFQYKRNIDEVLKTTYKNNLSRILSNNKNNIESLRYIALNLNYFWKFSKERENIILKHNFSTKFDTFLINMENYNIKDLSTIFRFLNLENYPNIKNIIIDNICISWKDIQLIMNSFILYNQEIHLHISKSTEIDDTELYFCQDFVFNSDHKLVKTKIIYNNYKLNIYHYDRELSHNNFYSNNQDLLNFIQWY